VTKVAKVKKVILGLKVTKVVQVKKVKLV
jgi:hypothetical protein